MKPAEPFSVKLGTKRGSGTTVLGAISNRREEIIFTTSNGTNRIAVLGFFILLATKLNRDMKTVVVLDNHPSHHTNEVV